MSLPEPCPDWSVYLIRTRLNALYCGISNNVERRFCMHQQGKGAKALKG
ncbi:GIY-YIG nuclease family protein, partial [Vibrio furnissii]